MDNHSPILAPVSVIINDQPWRVVDSFDNCASDDHVFVINRASSEIIFGDGIHGSKPSLGSRIETTYRTGKRPNDNVLSFAWTVTDPSLHKTLLATVTTLPNSFRLSIHEGIENSWRWKLITWLCDVLKANLLDSVFSKK